MKCMRWCSLQPFFITQIALPEQSENPILDELWNASESDWMPVKHGEALILSELEEENLPGCLRHIEVKLRST